MSKLNGRTVEHYRTPEITEEQRRLIDHPNSIFTLNENGRLEWAGEEEDVQIFQQLIQILSATRQLSDELFIEQVLPNLEEILAKSELFTKLNSKAIRVTTGHSGQTPYEHTIKVLRELKTDGIEAELRFFLRLTAIYHDAGKAISGGMTQKEINQLIPPEEKHSHPSHAELGAIIIRQLIDQVENRGKIADESFWEAMELVILYHHFFQDFKEQVQTEEQFLAFIRAVKLDLIAKIFLLCRADMFGGVNYAEYWQENVSAFQELLDNHFSAELTPEEKAQLFFYLSLATV